jgi:hypothetical protein
LEGVTAVAEEQAIRSATETVQSFAAKRRHVPLRLLYVGTAILILLLLATNFAVIVHLRRAVLSDEDGDLKTLSLILAEQAGRTFQSVDLVISSVAERIVADGVTDSASFDQKVASHDIHILLREKISGVQQLAAVILVNREAR